MNKFYFSIAFIIFLVHLKAQETEYIVFPENDTLFGEVRLPTSFGKPVYKDFIFIKKQNDTIEKKLYTYEVQCFVESGKEYLNYDNNILKLLISGKINLYECYVTKNYINKIINLLFHEKTIKRNKIRKYKRYYLKKENENPIIINKKHFKDTCSEYFSDKFLISDRISRGVYKYKDLPEIVKNYNR